MTRSWRLRRTPGAGGRSHAARGASRGRSQASLAATGENLSERVRRLLGASPPSVASGPAVGALLVVAGMVLATGRGKTPLRPRPVQEVTPTQVELPPLLAQVQPPTAMPAGTTSANDRWLNEDVVYRIDDRERAAFPSLQADTERASTSSSGCAAIPRPVRSARRA